MLPYSGVKGGRWTLVVVDMGDAYDVFYCELVSLLGIKNMYTLLHGADIIVLFVAIRVDKF